MRLMLMSLAAAAGLLAAHAANATTYAVTPVDLGGGYTLSGRVQTNGATGQLTAGDIAGWSLTVTSVNDIIYTPANTHNISTGVFATANDLRVTTPSGGVTDGGALAFRGGNYFRTAVADFTSGAGEASYVAGGAFDARPLSAQGGVDYIAAVGSAGVFDLKPIRFSPEVVMSGTITTDGALGAAKITDWAIRVRETRRWSFGPANSQVISALNLRADHDGLYVTPFDGDFNPGALSFGRFSGGFDFSGVVLADFTTDPGGYAGYISPFEFQVVSPLPLRASGDFRVASRAVPEPATWSLMLTGFFLTGTVVRRRRGAFAGMTSG